MNERSVTTYSVHTWADPECDYNRGRDAGWLLRLIAGECGECRSAKRQEVNDD